MIVLLAAAEAVDTFYFGGQYRDAVWQETKREGRQFRYQVRLFVQKDIAP